MFSNDLSRVLDLLTSISGLMIAYVGAYAVLLYIRRLRLDRARFTLEMMLKFRLNEAADFPFAKRTDEFREFVSSGGSVDEVPPLFARLADLEGLAMALRKGLLDEDMLFDYAGNVFMEAFEKSRPVIEMLRERNDRPYIYSDLEAVARRWSFKSFHHVS